MRPYTRLQWCLFSVLVLSFFQGRWLLRGADTIQRQIDLVAYEPNPFFNYEPPTTGLMALPRGSLESAGTVFSISRYCGLIGYPRDPDRPAYVGGILVDAFVKHVHLLQCCDGSVPDGQPVYGVRFHYSDGSRAIQWLEYGSDLDEWWGRRVAPLATHACRAWVGTCRETASFRVFLQMFHTRIDNPYPGKKVESLDLVSAVQSCSPLVGAITLDVLEQPPKAPLEHPLPSPDFGVVRELRIRLLDSESKGPVTNADVQVLVNIAGHDVWLKGFRTGPDGVAWCFVPQTALRPEALEFFSGTHLPKRVALSMEDLVRYRSSKTPIDFQLDKGVSIGGTVTDSLGTPVPGASIEVSQIQRAPGGEYAEQQLGLATADSQGRWQAACLRKGFEQVFLSVVAHGFVPALYEEESPQAGSPLQVSAKDLLAQKAALKLENSMDLYGRVTAEGKPVPNAQVSLIYGVPTDIASRKTATDSNGQFRITGLESGQGYVFVDSDRAAPAVRPVQWYLKNADINFDLVDGKARTGTVRDQSGSPVPDAMVLPNQWSEGPALGEVIHTDENGNFTWPHSPDGDVWAQVALLGAMSTTPPLPLKPPGTPSSLSIDLPQRPAIRLIRIVDARDGKPVSRFFWLEGRSYGGSTVFWQGARRQTGRDGNLIFPAQNLQGAQALLGIEAPGYAPLTIDGTALARQSVFKLQPDPGLFISLKLPSGAAAAQSTVVMLREGDYALLEPDGRIRSAQGGPPVMTGDDGNLQTFRITDLQWIVAGAPGGIAACRWVEGQTNYEITLQAPGTIAGHVRIGPSTKPSDQVRLQTFYSLDSSVGRLPFMMAQAPTVGTTGAFTFSNVPPSRTQVALVFTGFRSPTQGYIMTWSSHARPVLVRPGQTAKVILGGSGRSLVGKLVYRSNASETTWVANIQRASLVQNREMPKALRMPVLRPGGSPERAREMIQAYVRRRQTWLDSPDGVQWVLDRTEYALRIAPGGAFRVDSVPPGQYTLQINSGTSGAPVSLPITVPPGADSVPVDLGEISIGD